MPDNAAASPQDAQLLGASWFYLLICDRPINSASFSAHSAVRKLWHKPCLRPTAALRRRSRSRITSEVRLLCCTVRGAACKRGVSASNAAGPPPRWRFGPGLLQCAHPPAPVAGWCPSSSAFVRTCRRYKPSLPLPPPPHPRSRPVPAASGPDSCLVGEPCRSS